MAFPLSLYFSPVAACLSRPGHGQAEQYAITTFLILSVFHVKQSIIRNICSRLSRFTNGVLEMTSMLEVLSAIILASCL